MAFLRRISLSVLVALPVACAGHKVPPTQRERSVEAVDRPAASVTASAPSEPASWPALLSTEPARGAPAGLSQFGRLVGVWMCTSEQRQQDGTFKPGPGTSTWTWFYTLGGAAVQDIFEPASGAIGTNLRIYDAKADAWEIQWTTGALNRFERITARADGDRIIMHGDVGAGPRFPAHRRRITFYDITDVAFEWKYEATKPGSDENWSEFSRLHCKRG